MNDYTDLIMRLKRGSLDRMANYAAVNAIESQQRELVKMQIENERLNDELRWMLSENAKLREELETANQDAERYHYRLYDRLP